MTAVRGPPVDKHCCREL